MAYYRKNIRGPSLCYPIQCYNELCYKEVKVNHLMMTIPENNKDINMAS